MNIKKSLLALSLSLPALALASTNLVTNGGFEDYDQASGSWSIYGSGHGWTTDANGIEIRNNVAGQASEGNNFAELDTTANSSIWQRIYVTEGRDYTLSFDYANRSRTQVGSNGLGWSFAGASGYAAVQPRNRTDDNQWQSFSTTVTADLDDPAATSFMAVIQASFTGWTTLLFSAEGVSDSYGTSLDNISVTSVVPEPTTGALVLAGLGVLVVVGRRRKI